MRYMGLNEIREAYLAFFERHGHLRLPSFSLVPQDDPSLLLINAGMTPMKPWFRGTETPPSRRITTCQKCIRTPDIERVGQTARHGTFFEMLGNFSFGDYFKAEIIPWAWELSTEVYGLDPERIHASVYIEDDEAYRIWHKVVGLPAERIVRLGKEDNFWEHGTGPCGPCSEVFYDRGVEYGCGEPDCGPACECDRFLEYWNLVFTQFDRLEDGSYVPLAQRNIDTGAGLERIAAILQGVDNLFEVDTIRSILDRVCVIAGIDYGADERHDVAIRVITDHIRSTTMMVSDGILPSNEGRGYVLRRLLRRAARYGRMLGIERPFLVELAEVVMAQSREAYPELEQRRDYILGVIEREEARFAQTIAQGSGLLERLIAETRERGGTELDGVEVFRLHDTYGFPLDLTREIAHESGLEVDEADFQSRMAQQRQQARDALAARGGSAWSGAALPREIEQLAATCFSGYDELRGSAVVLGIAGHEETSDEALSALEAAAEGSEILLVCDTTPFYARAGGQVGDQGVARDADGLEIEIVDTTVSGSGVYLHRGHVRQGLVRVGQLVELEVDRARRLSIARNHTATHLLHRALRDTLGAQVAQAGSEVAPDRLRFDFSSDRPLTSEELDTVQAMVNRAILDDRPLTTRLMSLDEARKAGAMALFDEKYGSEVRVIAIEGDTPDAAYSLELCGGTHLARTSQACLFTITSEASIAAGVRRIEALTGEAAMARAATTAHELDAVAQLLRSETSEAAERIRALQAELRQLERANAQLESTLASGQTAALEQEATDVDGVRIVCATVDAAGADALRDATAKLRDRLAPAVILLAAEQGERWQLVAMASPEAVSRGAHCGQLIRAAAQAAGGGGGGKPEMAQAGARDGAAIPAALELARSLAAEQLTGK